MIRTPHEVIDLPVERGKDMFSDGFASLFRRMQTRYYPYAPELMELFASANSPKELVAPTRFPLSSRACRGTAVIAHSGGGPSTSSG